MSSYAMPAIDRLGTPTGTRAIARIVAPAAARHGPAFSALRIGGQMFGREADPFLALDHFHMTGPTFPPHAHAGFSAVTYMLPASRAGMFNRDSLGDSSLILPGGLHWTAAGGGIVHEEVPDRPSAAAEGFQIFVRQPVAQERTQPVIHHVDPADIPVARLADGGVARILAGSFGGISAAFEPPSPLLLLDIDLPAGAGFRFASEWAKGSCAIYLFAGALDLGGRTIAATNVAVFERGGEPVQVHASAAARFALLAGQPIDAPAVSNGPFVLSSQAALDDAIRRYAGGAMGVLD